MGNIKDEFIAQEEIDATSDERIEEFYQSAGDLADIFDRAVQKRFRPTGIKRYTFTLTFSHRDLKRQRITHAEMLERVLRSFPGWYAVHEWARQRKDHYHGVFYSDEDFDEVDARAQSVRGKCKFLVKPCGVEGEMCEYFDRYLHYIHKNIIESEYEERYTWTDAICWVAGDYKRYIEDFALVFMDDWHDEY